MTSPRVKAMLEAQAEHDRVAAEERAARGAAYERDMHPDVDELAAQHKAAERAAVAAAQARVRARHVLQDEMVHELREIRERLGLSRPEIASLVGVAVSEITEIENRRGYGLDHYERLLNGYRGLEKVRGGAAPAES